MPKKAAHGAILTLLLTSMLMLTFNISLVKASGTIYIRADGSVDPPTAHISTSDNVTYTLTGNIFKSIVVERSNIIINGNLYTVQGDGSGRSFSLSNVNNVTIKKTKIKYFFSGVYFNNSSNNSMIGNSITLNNNGIEFTDSLNNSIIGNSITGNSGAGILLTHSLNNSIIGNNMTSNGYGVYLYSSSNNNSIIGNNVTANNNGIGLSDSSNNILRSNILTDNTYNLDVWGLTPTHFINDIDDSNTVEGKPIYYWINETDAIVPPDAGYIALVNCTHISVQNLTLISNTHGILLAYTVNSTIIGNNIKNNYFGIRLKDSSNNSIYHNSFVNNVNQVSAYNSVNIWDDGYPSGGNYWSDYDGTDVYSGPYQNDAGSDGIADTPHVIGITIQDNYPLMKSYGGLFDIGITDVTVSETIVGQGCNITITVKTLNYGVAEETFNLTVYAGISAIQNITNIALPSRNSTITTFTWNTTGFAKGNYTVSAVVDSIPGETDTNDNVFINGWVFVLSSEHDVAIMSITSRPIVGEGYTSPIRVKAMNVGAYTETFNVTLYVHTTYIASQNITLGSGASTTATIVWNTSGFAKGNYTISAYAWPVPDESDTTDNNSTNEWILVTKVGDFGSPIMYVPTFFICDGKVDAYDLALFIACYRGSAMPEAIYLGDLGGPVNYIPTFFACDGRVDAYDLALFVQIYKGQGP